MPVEAQFHAEPLALEEMGPPRTERSVGGRLNAKGERYWYGALDPMTAISETRPWVGARVTIAEFRTTGPMDVVDLTGDGTRGRGERIEWVSFMLSRPVHREDADGYVATQLLAEALAERGVSGILYDSSLMPRGVNLAVFDPGKVEALVAELREILTVDDRCARLVPDPSPLTRVAPAAVGECVLLCDACD